MTTAAKSEWYRDRINWRATENGLAKRGHCVADSLDPEKARRIRSWAGESTTPLVLLWDSDERWTVVTSEELIGYEDGQLKRIGLDQIQKTIDIEQRPADAERLSSEAALKLLKSWHPERTYPPNFQVRESQEVKFLSEHLLVGPAKLRFWAPPGPPIFSLWNLLRMFPLNLPPSQGSKDVV